MESVKRDIMLTLALLASLASLSAAQSAYTATPITSCGKVISAPGDYVLANDLTCVSGDAIRITASNVTLRLAGHTIAGGCCPPTADGIQVGPGPNLEQPHDVKIIGPGRITSFLFGVHFLGALSSQVTGLTLLDNHDAGIKVDADSVGRQSSRNLFSANVATDNGIGLWDVGGHFDRYVGNAVSQTANGNLGGFGITIETDENIVHGNQVSGHFLGILLQGGNRNSILANLVTDNFQLGIVIASGSGNVVHANSAVRNGTDLADADATCTLNSWKSNAFTTATPCIQ